jgi:hypothetical protein
VEPYASVFRMGNVCGLALYPVSFLWTPEAENAIEMAKLFMKHRRSVWIVSRKLPTHPA